MNSKVYKSCAVPECNNTSIKTPNKLFVHVPKKLSMRNKWLSLARRDPAVSPNTPMYFCEEHFDLSNDMENYYQYHLMGSVSQIRMKPGCLPSKFGCQPGRKKRPSERPYILKKRRKMIVEQCVKEFEENNLHPKDSQETHKTAKKSKQGYRPYKPRRTPIQTENQPASEVTSPGTDGPTICSCNKDMRYDVHGYAMTHYKDAYSSNTEESNDKNSASDTIEEEITLSCNKISNLDTELDSQFVNDAKIDSKLMKDAAKTDCNSKKWHENELIASCHVDRKYSTENESKTLQIKEEPTTKMAYKTDSNIPAVGETDRQFKIEIEIDYNKAQENIHSQVNIEPCVFNTHNIKKEMEEVNQPQIKVKNNITRDLYNDHIIKDEMVIGQENIQEITKTNSIKLNTITNKKLVNGERIASEEGSKCDNNDTTVDKMSKSEFYSSCTQCMMNSDHPTSSKRPLCVHETVRNYFACAICLKIYFNQNNLFKHMAVHSGKT